MTNTYTFKKHVLVLFAISITILSQAQPKLVGMMWGGGPSNNGTVIHYTGGDTFISKVDTLSSAYNYSNSPSVNMTQGADGKYYYISNSPSMRTYDYDADTFGYGPALIYDSIGLVLGPITLASNGIKYGMGYNGGAYGGGTIFAYTPSWCECVTTLVDLPAYSYPTGTLMQSADGYLYGILGSNTFFRFNMATKQYKSICAFPGPCYSSNLIEIGVDTFYGLTESDTLSNGGSIFRVIVSADTGTYIHLFSLPDMAQPVGCLLRASNDLLYGLTTFDGTYSMGTIFSYNLQTGVYDTLHNFGEINYDAQIPAGDLYQASDGNLYGIASLGGRHGAGAIFQYNISNSTYSLMVSLDSFTTGYPYNPSSEIGHLTEYMPVSHGMTRQPANDTVSCPGGMVTFISADSSTLPVSLLWEYSMDSGSHYYPIDSATDTLYTFYATDAMNGYKFRAVYSSGDVSDVVTLTVLDGVHAYFTLLPSATPHVWDITNLCSGPSSLSYIWSWGDSSANSNGDTPSHTYASPGYYNICVTVSDSQGCTANYCDTNVYLYKNQSGQMVQVKVLPQNTNGIANINDYHFSLYPNPAQGSFTIIHNYSGAINVKVADVLGAVVRQFDMNGKQEGFDISGFAPGLYIISLATDAGETLKTFKLVKE